MVGAGKKGCSAEAAVRAGSKEERVQESHGETEKIQKLGPNPVVPAFGTDFN